MAKKSGGVMFKDEYNEVDSKDPNVFDDSGAGNYVSYDEVMSMHLSDSDADLDGSPNSRSGEGIFGGPAPGEPNPTKMSVKNASK